MDLVNFTPPHEEFSHFAAQKHNKKLPAAELKDILKFLNNGRRGYLLVLSEGHEQGLVRPGDKVFAVPHVLPYDRLNRQSSHKR